MKLDPEGSADAALQCWMRALRKTQPIAANPKVIFPMLMESLAERYGAAPALLSDRDCLSYSMLADRTNRYSRWALENGLSFGDVVCLMMPNCPDYMAIWMGLSRIGVIVALINTNLKGAALAHSIAVAAPRCIIISADLAGVLPDLGRETPCWVHGAGGHALPAIHQAIREYSGAPLDGTLFRPPSIHDQALYIYTSGTTGLPKAAKVSHFRVMQWTLWFAGMMDTRADDRMYNCLPMYHSTGGVVATGALLVSGGSVVIRERFSASRFWDDVTQSGCTLFQYIGELCRYLVRSPPHQRDTAHRLRLCCGNGLRPDIWTEFQQRFAIPRILEFYAATEGAFSLYNCEGKPGAIGRIPPFLPQRAQVAIVKFDTGTGQPARGDDGFCIRARTDETGEAIGRLATGSTASSGQFEGYTDADASAGKILRDVFSKGDEWFRTGDLMRRDASGYFYFEDRVGDTFRWKGENVSASQVARTICGYPGVIDVVVYGVRVPQADGRAGMAAITISQAFDLTAFRRHLIDHLPDYAQPLFLRVCERIELTPTFKPKTDDLIRQGYDPGAGGDVYFNDRVAKAFVPLGRELSDRIRNGAMVL